MLQKLHHHTDLALKVKRVKCSTEAFLDFCLHFSSATQCDEGWLVVMNTRVAKVTCSDHQIGKIILTYF